MGKCFLILKKMIKKCDYFGTFVTFRINDEIEYKSIIGGITSILFFILSISYSIYVGYPFIKRENIDFIFSNKIIETQPYINLTSVNYNMAFGIQYLNDASSAINDYIKYFNYSIILKEWIGIDKITSFTFGLKKCTKSDFFNLVNDSFDRNQISGMLCPILNKSVNYTIDGLYTDYYYKFFEIDIKLTDYGMKHLNEVRNLIEKRRIEMAIYFIDTAIHYQNRYNPLPLYINYLTKEIDLDFVKTFELLISTIEFTNDDNLFFKNEKTIIDATFDKNEETFYYVSSRKETNNYLIGKFLIKASSKVLVLNRSYQKFPSFIADLVGILEEILLIILFLVNIIERQAIENKLIHKMLKMKGSKNFDINYFLSVFKKEKTNNNVINLIKKNSISKNYNNNNNNMINIENNDKQKIINKNIINSKKEENLENSFPNEIHSFFQNKDNENSNYIKKNYTENKIKILNKYCLKSIQYDDVKIYSKKPISINYSNNQSDMNLNYVYDNNKVYLPIKRKNTYIKKAEDEFHSINIICAVFTYIFFWTIKYQKRRYELLQKAEKKIHYYLEIFNYIKKIQEIDLIKYCLFDKKQLILLNFLSYPSFKINLNSVNEIYQEFENEQLSYKKIQKKEIDEIFNCYNSIKNKNNMTYEDFKLLKLIDADVEILN